MVTAQSHEYTMRHTHTKKTLIARVSLILWKTASVASYSL